MADVVSIPVDGSDTTDIGVEKTEGLSTELTGGEAGQVKMIGPLGRITYADPDQIQAFEDQGYTVESLDQTIGRAIGEGREQEFGGALGDVEAFGRGGARVLTFGVSDQVLDPEIGKILEEVNPTATFIGELTGTAVGLASGRAPGIVSKLTPRGHLEALATRYIAQGSTTGARMARGAITEAGLGAGDLAGNYLSRVALDEDKQFSFEALGNEIAKGAIIGGVTGAIGGRFTDADEATQIASLRKAIPEEDATVFRKILGEDVDSNARTKGLPKRGTKDVDLDEIATPALAASSKKNNDLLHGRIQSFSRRSASQEADEALQSPVFRAALDDQEYLNLSNKIRALAKESDEATQLARRWSDDYLAQLGKPKNNAEFKEALKKVSPTLDSEAGPILARFDQTTIDFEKELSKLTTASNAIKNLSPESKLAAVYSPAILQQTRSMLGNIASSVKANPVISKTIEVGSKVAEAAEVAQTFGVDVPSLSDLFGGRDTAMGQAVGLYMQAKAGARAFKGGVDKAARLGFPVNPLTRAAGTVNNQRMRLINALDKGVSRVTSSLKQRAPSLLTAGAVEAMKRFDPEIAKTNAAEAVMDLPTDIADGVLQQVDRVTNYLENKKPKNGNQGTPYQKEWRVNPIDDHEYARRAKSALDPIWAISEIFSKPGNTLEIEALKECHPDLFLKTQLKVLEIAETKELREKLDPSMAQSLGQGFGIPLTMNLLPGYGQFNTQTQSLQGQTQPRPDFGSPSATSVNPLVETEEITTRRSR